MSGDDESLSSAVRRDIITSAIGSAISGVRRWPLCASCDSLTSCLCSADEALVHSGKMVVLLTLLRECKAVGDRVIVFSRWMHTLAYVERLLHAYNAQIATDPAQSKRQQ